MKAIFVVLIKAFVSFLTNLALSLASEKFIEWFFFMVAGKFADSTKTKVDDKFVKQMEESYKTYMEKK